MEDIGNIEKVAAAIAGLSTIAGVLWAAIQKIVGTRHKPSDELVMLQAAKLRQELAAIDPKLVAGIPHTYGATRTEKEVADDKRGDFQWAMFAGSIPTLLAAGAIIFISAFQGGGDVEQALKGGATMAASGLIAMYILAKLLTRVIKSDIVRPILSFFLGIFVMVGAFALAVVIFD